MKRITLFDICMIIIIAAISAGFIIFAWGWGSRGSIVHIDTPTDSYEYPLDKNQTLSIRGSRGITVIEISGGSVRFVSSSCPSQTCVGMGAVRYPNVPIICLPNRVSAYIIGESEFDAISR